MGQSCDVNTGVCRPMSSADAATDPQDASVMADASSADAAIVPDGAVAVDGASPVPDAAIIDTFRRRITLTTPANVTDDLSDFPVAIVITDDAHLRDNAQPDGADLLFITDDGTSFPNNVLKYEIESYDGDTGSLVAWVRIPTLTAASPTDIFLHYGDDSASDRQDPANTWPSSTIAVWHLVAEPLNALVDEYPNSVAADFHGSAQETQRPVVADGIAGGGVLLDGIDDSILIEQAQAGVSALDPGADSFSLSMWVNVSTAADTFDQPWVKGNGQSGAPGASLQLGVGSWALRIADTDNDAASLSFGSLADFTNRWVHVVLVIDRVNGTAGMFIDGAAVSAPPINLNSQNIGTIASSDNARIGGNSFVFRGAIDEVRVFDAALSANFIAAESANLADYDNFVAIAAPEVAAYPR